MKVTISIKRQFVTLVLVVFSADFLNVDRFKGKIFRLRTENQGISSNNCNKLNLDVKDNHNTY